MASTNGFVRFLGYLWRGVDGLRKLLHLILLALIFGVLVGVLSDAVPEPPKSAALHVRPIGYLVDELEGDAVSRALSELQGNAVPQTLVRDVVEAIDRASEDKNVPGIVLDLGGLAGGGLSKLQDIAAALQRFKSTGKPIHAVGFYFSQDAYFLAANATDIWMAPTGGVEMMVYGRYRNYFREAIEKLSVQWNVFRIGEYKSFAEPYLRNDMSEESKEASGAVLDALWSDYLAGVSDARGVPLQVLQAMTERPAEFLFVDGKNWGEVLLESGLVTELLTRPEAFDRLRDKYGENRDGGAGYNAIGISAYLTAQRTLELPLQDDAEIAVVVASGPVVDGDAPPGQIGGLSTARLIRQARMDEDVKALVLRVDSGGGSVMAADEIRSELDAFRATGRPYVASMGSVAASAGYWISAPANQIFASPSTITGSIGVVAMIPTFEDSLSRIGVYTDGVGTTPLAGQFRVDRTMNDTAKRLIQKIVDDDYDRFISGVATYRGMAKADVDAIARGRIWSGADALDRGLVDQLGDLDAAIAAAAEIADLGDDFEVRYIEREVSPFEKFLLDMTKIAKVAGVEFTAPRRASATLLDKLDRLVQDVARFNDPRGIYSLCFCEMP